MFKEPFNFALQRTPLQALGWYLIFLLITFLIGAIVGALSATINSAVTMDAGIKAGLSVGRYFAPVVPTLVAFAVLIPRKLSASNVLLGLLAILASVFLGWIGAGIILAYLTTRPPRISPASEV